MVEAVIGLFNKLQSAESSPELWLLLIFMLAASAVGVIALCKELDIV